MKVIDLIKEKPYKVIWGGCIYELVDNEYRRIEDGWRPLFRIEELNDEVEIIEDKKIEKMNEFIHCDSLDYRTCNRMFEEITEKVNEIIDKINEGE